MPKHSVSLCLHAGWCPEEDLFKLGNINDFDCLLLFINGSVLPQSSASSVGFCMASTVGAKGLCLQSKDKDRHEEYKTRHITIIRTWFRRLNDIYFQILMIKDFTSFEDVILVNLQDLEPFLIQTLNILLVHNEI